MAIVETRKSGPGLALAATLLLALPLPGIALAQSTAPAPSSDAFFDAGGNALDRGPILWERRPVPTVSDFPDRILRHRGPLTVVAVVECRAEVDGRLSDCRALQEEPRGFGAGSPAVRIVRRGRLQSPIAPDSTGQQPTVRVIIPFIVG